MITPTPEHFAEAHRVCAIDTPIGAITRMAHSLAAFEARGAGKRASFVLQADLDAMEERHASILAGYLKEIKMLTNQVAEAEERAAELAPAASEPLWVGIDRCESDVDHNVLIPVVVGPFTKADAILWSINGTYREAHRVGRPSDV